MLLFAYDIMYRIILNKYANIPNLFMNIVLYINDGESFIIYGDCQFVRHIVKLYNLCLYVFYNVLCMLKLYDYVKYNHTFINGIRYFLIIYLFDRLYLNPVFI